MEVMTKKELTWWMNHYHDRYVEAHNKIVSGCYMIINPDKNVNNDKEKEK